MLRARHSGSHYSELAECPGCNRRVPESRIDEDERNCDACACDKAQGDSE